MSDSNNSSNRRNFLTNITKVMGGVGAVFAAIPFLSSMSPSEKTKMAGAPIEIDISGIQPGAFKIVEWRGKPVFIKRRTNEEIAEARNVKMEDLKDPQKDEDRAKNPEW